MTIKAYYKSYKALNIAGFKNKLTRELVYYYIAQRLNIQNGGAGWVHEETFAQIIAIQHKVKPRTVKKILISGNGKFYTLQNGRIWIYKPYQVLRNLTNILGPITLRYQKRPLQELLQPTLKKRRAYMNRAILEQSNPCRTEHIRRLKRKFPERIEKLYARETLAKKANITVQTSRRYDRIINKTKQNKQKIDKIYKIPRNENLKTLIELGLQIRKYDNLYWIVKQRPNTYKTNQQIFLTRLNMSVKKRFALTWRQTRAGKTTNERDTPEINILNLLQEKSSPNTKTYKCAEELTNKTIGSYNYTTSIFKTK